MSGCFGFRVLSPTGWKEFYTGGNTNETSYIGSPTKLISCSFTFSLVWRGHSIIHESRFRVYLPYQKGLESLQAWHPGPLLLLLPEPAPGAWRTPVQVFAACFTHRRKRCSVPRLLFWLESDFSKMYFHVHYDTYPIYPFGHTENNSVCMHSPPNSILVMLVGFYGLCPGRQPILQLPDTQKPFFRSTCSASLNSKPSDLQGRVPACGTQLL